MIFKNLKNILKIFLDTPKKYLILLFAIFSSFFSLIGIPLLLPAINLLTNNQNLEKDKIYIFYENFFSFFDLSVNFNNLILFALIFIFLGQIISLFTELFSQRIQVKLINQYMANLLEGYYKSSWLYMNDVKSGNLHSGLSRESTLMSEAHLDSLRFASSLLFLSTYLMISFIIFPKFIIFIFIYFIVTSIPILVITSFTKKLSKKNNLTQIDLSSLITNLLNNKKFFKSSTNYFGFKEVIKEKINFIMNTNWKMIFFNGSLRTYNFLIGMIMLIIVLVMHETLNLKIPEILILLFVFSRTVPAYITFANNFTRIVEKIPIYFLFKEKKKDLELNEEKFSHNKYESESIIKFENVSFSYGENKDSVLKNIELTIKPYSTIAITGPSGSGKSTLVDLLLGLIKPQKGKILYGNNNNETIDYRTFRKKVSYVSQNSTLIDGSVDFNMKILNKNETKENIIKACKLAAMHETIENFPGKYEYQIGENGSRLSGGQRQRLTIARSLLNNPEIIIFDEATNQLDKETEKLIQETIKKLSHNKTIIIITHKLENYKNIDQVYEIENNEIKKNINKSKIL
jgi:ABC-type bacteriocin/lantibiotic exporter with double-glycine peptidase domain